MMRPCSLFLWKLLRAALRAGPRIGGGVGRRIGGRLHGSLHGRSRSLRRASQRWVRAGLLGVLAAPAHAAGANMPWEGPLQAVLDSGQGPEARIVAVIIIITTGLTLAFGDTSGGFRRLIQIVFGLSIAFAASSFFLGFFSFSGGAVLA